MTVVHNEDWLGTTVDGEICMLAREFNPEQLDDFQMVIGGSRLSRAQVFEFQETAEALGLHLHSWPCGVRSGEFFTSDPDQVNKLLKYTSYSGKFGTHAKNVEGNCWFKKIITNVDVVKAYWLDTQKVLAKGQTTTMTVGYSKTDSMSNNTSESTTLSVEVSGNLPFGAEGKVGSTKENTRSHENSVSITSNGSKSDSIVGPGTVYYLVVELSNKQELRVVSRLMVDGEEPKPLSSDEVRDALKAMNLE